MSDAPSPPPSSSPSRTSPYVYVGVAAGVIVLAGVLLYVFRKKKDPGKPPASGGTRLADPFNTNKGVSAPPVEGGSPSINNIKVNHSWTAWPSIEVEVLATCPDYWDLVLLPTYTPQHGIEVDGDLIGHTVTSCKLVFVPNEKVQPEVAALADFRGRTFKFKTGITSPDTLTWLKGRSDRANFLEMQFYYDDVLMSPIVGCVVGNYINENHRKVAKSRYGIAGGVYLGACAGQCGFKH